jgi:polar amino acid transport system substrate-binding protein
MRLQVLVLKNSTATSLDSLHGQKVCATTGSDSVDRIPQHKAIAVRVPYWTNCLVKLQRGDVAAISTDVSILDGLAAQDRGPSPSRPATHRREPGQPSQTASEFVGS